MIRGEWHGVGIRSVVFTPQRCSGRNDTQKSKPQGLIPSSLQPGQSAHPEHVPAVPSSSSRSGVGWPTRAVCSRLSRCSGPWLRVEPRRRLNVCAVRSKHHRSVGCAARAASGGETPRFGRTTSRPQWSLTLPSSILSSRPQRTRRDFANSSRRDTSSFVASSTEYLEATGGQSSSEPSSETSDRDSATDATPTPRT